MVQQEVCLMISSYIGNEDGNDVQRYDRSKKQHISVCRPSIIAVCNKSMGGVDLMDMLCSLYKYQLRSKKMVYLHLLPHFHHCASKCMALIQKRLQNS